MKKQITGRIHSVETAGMVDGPGIRYVIFMQGCPLRCLYCHNPDSWDTKGGKRTSVDKLIKDISKYKSYISGKKGGVTISGGEPLLQPEFVKEIFKRCKEMSIHTALDTSGFVNLDVAKDVLEYVDLVLLDIKAMTPALHKKVTNVSNVKILAFANYLKEIKKPVWIRFVLVPNLTSGLKEVQKISDFISTLDNVERVCVLPFHKMGEYKWEELGLDYKLKETMTPDKELVDKVRAVLLKGVKSKQG